jgi:hypothetical protein
MLTSRISLYICFSSHTRKYMHTNRSSIRSFSKSCYTSLSYACSSFVSIALGFLPGGLTLALMPRGSLPSGFTHACSVVPGLYTRWSFVSSLLSMYLLVLSCHINIVSMLSHIQITSSHAFFTNFYQYMHT